MKTLHEYITERFVQQLKTIKTEQEFAEYLNTKIKQSPNGIIDLSNLSFDKSLKYLNNLFDAYIYNELSYLNGDSAEYDEFQKMLDNLKEIKSLNVSGWQTNNVKTLTAIFQGLANLEEIYGLDTWNLDSCEDVSMMFSGCKNLKEITGFEKFLQNIKKGTETRHMLFGCKSLDDNYKELLKKYEIS